MNIHFCFHAWELALCAASVRQFDDRAQTLRVTGDDIPAGWTWHMHLSVPGGYFNAIPLTEADGALTAVLTREDLAFGDEIYTLQLVGTRGDVTRHTNCVRLHVGASLSGEEAWPEVPDSFTRAQTAAETAAEQAAASAAAAAQSARGAGEALSDAEELNDLFAHRTEASVNLFDQTQVTVGQYCTNTGQIAVNENYCYSGRMPVVPGKTYTAQRGNLTVAQGRDRYEPRWICAYDENGTVLPDKGWTSSGSYTVPEGVAYVTICGAAGYFKASQHMAFVEGETVLDFTPYAPPTDRITHLKAAYHDDAHILELIASRGRHAKPLAFSASADTLAAGGELVAAQRIDNKKNCAYRFSARFDTFDTVSVGHGFDTYMGAHVTVDAQKITAFYSGASGDTVVKEAAHGLELGDFLLLEIDVADTEKLRAVVRVITASGSFTLTDVPFAGCSGDVAARTTTALRDAALSYVCRDARHDVYVFGDSYVSLGDPNRWPYQLMQRTQARFLLSGYSGATSRGELTSLKNMFAVSPPRVAVWALGMNDPDSDSAANANWLAALYEVEALCDACGTELVLATIPNTPALRHTFKNAVVRESEHRYVDFAAAVGAEAEASAWYAGMLASDETHPTASGASALAARFLLDVPEAG